MRKLHVIFDARVDTDYLQAGRQEGMEKIFYRQLPSLYLACREHMCMRVDGEQCEGSDFRFSIEPGRLPIYLPSTAPLLPTGDGAQAPSNLRL